MTTILIFAVDIKLKQIECSSNNIFASKGHNIISNTNFRLNWSSNRLFQ